MQSLKIEKEIWPDKAIYFLTDATFLHYPYFRTDDQKQIVLNQIIRLHKELKIPISDYSIACNHYHIKFYLDKADQLAKAKQLLRGGISYTYRKKHKVPYKEMWQTRKILIIWDQDTNWRVNGYIIGNLLKHKEVSTLKELKENRYSSFWYMVQKYGEKEMMDLVRSVINTGEDPWGAVNIKGLSRAKINK